MTTQRIEAPASLDGAMRRRRRRRASGIAAIVASVAILTGAGVLVRQVTSRDRASSLVGAGRPGASDAAPTPLSDVRFEIVSRYVSSQTVTRVDRTAIKRVLWGEVTAQKQWFEFANVDRLSGLPKADAEVYVVVVAGSIKPGMGEDEDYPWTIGVVDAATGLDIWSHSSKPVDDPWPVGFDDLVDRPDPARTTSSAVPNLRAQILQLNRDASAHHAAATRAEIKQVGFGDLVRAYDAAHPNNKFSYPVRPMDPSFPVYLTVITASVPDGAGGERATWLLDVRKATDGGALTTFAAPAPYTDETWPTAFWDQLIDSGR